METTFWKKKSVFVSVCLSGNKYLFSLLLTTAWAIKNRGVSEVNNNVLRSSKAMLIWSNSEKGHSFLPVRFSINTYVYCSLFQILMLGPLMRFRNGQGGHLTNINCQFIISQTSTLMVHPFVCWMKVISKPDHHKSDSTSSLNWNSGEVVGIRNI